MRPPASRLLTDPRVVQNLGVALAQVRRAPGAEGRRPGSAQEDPSSSRGEGERDGVCARSARNGLHRPSARTLRRESEGTGGPRVRCPLATWTSARAPGSHTNDAEPCSPALRWGPPRSRGGPSSSAGPYLWACSLRWSFAPRRSGGRGGRISLCSRRSCAESRTSRLAHPMRVIGFRSGSMRSFGVATPS